MAGLQTIINYAENIEFDRRKVVGVQYTRSEIAKVSETPTRNAWKLNVKLSAALPYNTSRDLIEAIDNLDRRLPDYITFGGGRLNWITRYQAPDYGTMTTTLAQVMTVQSFNGTQLTLTNLPVVTGGMTANTPLFKAGDFIQLGSGTVNPYPFTVVNDVLRGTASTVTLTTHRPNFITTSVNGNAITVGSNVTFRMFATNMPTYTLIPGAASYSNGQLVNNAYLQWSDLFKLYEWTGDA
jgi:hypothetical protein